MVQERRTSWRNYSPLSMKHENGVGSCQAFKLDTSVLGVPSRLDVVPTICVALLSSFISQSSGSCVLPLLPHIVMYFAKSIVLLLFSFLAVDAAGPLLQQANHASSVTFSVSSFEPHRRSLPHLWPRRELLNPARTGNSEIHPRHEDRSRDQHDQLPAIGDMYCSTCP